MDDKVKGVMIWCSRKKNGIKLTSPNENLCNAYLKKANDALKSMNLNIAGGLHDWAVETAYYSRYHAIYALLQKCGIQSEIHDCSIVSIKYLFNNKLSEELIKELEEAKNQRKNLVYYVNREVKEEELKKNYENAPKFVLAIEKVISELKQEEIKEIIQKLSRTITPKNK